MINKKIDKDSTGNIPYFRYRGAANQTTATPQQQGNPNLPIPSPRIDMPQPAPPPVVPFGKISIDANGTVKLSTATQGTYATGSYKATFFFKRKNYEILEKGADL